MYDKKGISQGHGLLSMRFFTEFSGDDYLKEAGLRYEASVYSGFFRRWFYVVSKGAQFYSEDFTVDVGTNGRRAKFRLYAYSQ